MAYNICLALSDLLHFRMMISRSIHVAANSNISFFLWQSNIPICIYTYSKAHSLIIINLRNLSFLGIPWWSIGWESVLSTAKGARFDPRLGNKDPRSYVAWPPCPTPKSVSLITLGSSRE